MPQKLSAYAIKNLGALLGISRSICTRTLRNLTRYLHRNPPQLHQASSPPQPSGTSQGLCTGTFRNFTRYLPRNPTEPHHASSPRPFGTSSDHAGRQGSSGSQDSDHAGRHGWETTQQCMKGDKAGAAKAAIMKGDKAGQHGQRKLQSCRETGLGDKAARAAKAAIMKGDRRLGDKAAR